MWESFFSRKIHWLFRVSFFLMNRLMKCYIFSEWTWKNTTKLSHRNCHFLYFHSSIHRFIDLGIFFPHFHWFIADWFRCESHLTPFITSHLQNINKYEPIAFWNDHWPSFKNLKHFWNWYWNLIHTSWTSSIEMRAYCWTHSEFYQSTDSKRRRKEKSGKKTHTLPINGQTNEWENDRKKDDRLV